MRNTRPLNVLLRVIALAIVASLLPACGGDGGGDDSGAVPPPSGGGPGGGGGGGGPQGPGGGVGGSLDNPPMGDLVFTYPQQANSPVSRCLAAPGGAGDFYVSGFQTYGSVAAPLVRLNADGTPDAGFTTSFAGPPTVGLTVDAMAAAGGGTDDIYIAGSFTGYGGMAVDALIRLNSDGSLDVGFVVSSVEGSVYDIAMATDGSGDLYVVGPFSSINGVPRAGVARLNSDGSLDAGFAPGLGIGGGAASCVAVAQDGSQDIYVGGSFVSYDGVGLGRIARINSDGSLDTGFVAGVGAFNQSVFAVMPATDGSGRVYVGGSFSSFNGQPAQRIARLLPTGVLDPAYSTAQAIPSGTVRALAEDGAGGIYVGGDFDMFVTAAVGNFVHILVPGVFDPLFIAGFDDEVNDIAVSVDGSADIMVAGAFSSFGTLGAGGLCRLNANGTPEQNFLHQTAFNPGATVQVVAPAADGSGDVFAGGTFVRYNGAAKPTLARINADGTLDQSFQVGAGFADAPPSPAFPRAILPVADGDVYVGGQFVQYDGVAVGRLTRLNANGAIDTGFATGTGFNAVVYDIAPAGDGTGDVFVCGSFTSYNGSPAQGVVRLNSDGTVDTSFAGQPFGPGNRVISVVTPAGDGTGDVYVGGNFTTCNSVPRNRLARLNVDGTLDADFVPAITTGAWVHDIVVQDGDVYVAGRFSVYDGIAVQGLVRLNPDGSRDVGFGNGPGIGGVGGLDGLEVFSLAAAPDISGDVYIVGAFTLYNGATAQGLARINPNGTLDNAFNAGAGLAGARSIRIGANGDVCIGGSFNMYNGRTAVGICAANPNGTPD